MGYAKDREAFVYRMASAGWALYSIQRVLTQAGVLQRGAEIVCSVQMDERATTAHGERMDRMAKALLGEARHNGMGATCFGDCRGYVVHLFDKGQNPDTETGVPVPAQGYRASQMERMTRARV